jgi:hypothetical protein
LCFSSPTRAFSGNINFPTQSKRCAHTRACSDHRQGCRWRAWWRLSTRAGRGHCCTSRRPPACATTWRSRCATAFTRRPTTDRSVSRPQPLLTNPEQLDVFPSFSKQHLILAFSCAPCQVYLADLILLHGTEAAALTNKAAASAGASDSASPLPLEADLARAAPRRARVQVLGAVDGPSAEAPFTTVLLRRLLEPGVARAGNAAENAAGRGPTAGAAEPRGVGGFGGGLVGGFGGGVSSGLLSSSLAAHDSR